MPCAWGGVAAEGLDPVAVRADVALAPVAAGAARSEWATPAVGDLATGLAAGGLEVVAAVPLQAASVLMRKADSITNMRFGGRHSLPRVGPVLAL